MSQLRERDGDRSNIQRERTRAAIMITASLLDLNQATDHNEAPGVRRSVFEYGEMKVNQALVSSIDRPVSSIDRQGWQTVELLTTLRRGEQPKLGVKWIRLS